MFQLNTGITSNLSKEFQSQWDGGEDGDTIVKQFLDELDKIEGSHTAYLGINHFYLSKERVLAIIGQKKNLELRKSHAHSFLPIDVFVKKKNRISVIFYGIHDRFFIIFFRSGFVRSDTVSELYSANLSFFNDAKSKSNSL